MKKLLSIFLILIVALIAIGLYNYKAGIFDTKNGYLQYRELQSVELCSSDVQSWIADNKNPGVYIYKLKQSEADSFRYVILSVTKLVYGYQKANVKQYGNELRIDISNQNAVDDSQAKSELYLLVETKTEPKKISLSIDGKESKFDREVTARSAFNKFGVLITLCFLGCNQYEEVLP